MNLEKNFQAQLIKELKSLFPGCIILKNDARYKQGIPDLLILFNDKWAFLECKKSKTENHQPNQDFYIDKANEMSFGAFIYPENKEEVLNALQSALRS